MAIEHQKECHDPKDPECEECQDADMNRVASRQSDKEEPVRGMRDGLVIGLDFMGPFMTSVGGHTWLLNATEVRGYCVARPVKDKTAETVLEAVKDVVRKIRVALGPDMKFKVNKIRVHSDRDSTLLSTIVSEWVSE